MRKTALMMTVATLALAGCWEDEDTAAADDTAVTEEVVASEAQRETQELDGALPIEAADVEEQVSDEEAAALSDALAEAEAETMALEEQRVALEDEIARLRAEAARTAEELQRSRQGIEAREAAIRAELAAQRAELALEELEAQRVTDEEIRAQTPDRLQPYLGAWAQDADATTPDWVIGPDFLIWRAGACTITPTETTARFSLSDCRGNDNVEVVDLRIADDILTVIANGREYVLNEILIR